MMVRDSERDALDKIRGYLDAGHGLQAIRDAGWGSWLDYFDSKGVQVAQPSILPPPASPAPASPQPPGSVATGGVGGWLRRLISGAQAVSPEEREEVLQYYVKSLAITGLQEREADRYNSALLQHMNQATEPATAAVLQKAAARLAKCSKELIRRHTAMTDVPDRASEDYASWALVYQDYSNWAVAQRDVFEALAQGREPYGPRVKELFEQSEKQREKGEEAGKRLLKPVGIKIADVQRLYEAGQTAIAAVDWDPGED